MHSLLEESGQWTRCHHIHQMCPTALPGAPTLTGVLPKVWYCTLKHEITSYNLITYSSKNHGSCQVCWAVKLLNCTDQVHSINTWSFHGIYICVCAHTHTHIYKNSNKIFFGLGFNQEVPRFHYANGSEPDSVSIVRILTWPNTLSEHLAWLSAQDNCTECINTLILCWWQDTGYWLGA